MWWNHLDFSPPPPPPHTHTHTHTCFSVFKGMSVLLDILIEITVIILFSTAFYTVL